MADYAAIATGLETNLATISGLRAYDIFEGSVSLPAAVVDLPDIEFDIAMQRGADTWEIPVHVVVSKAAERSGRKKLGEYLDSTGSTSIKTAIESDKTLGGAVMTTRVLRIESKTFNIAGIDYLGATATVEVIA